MTNKVILFLPKVIRKIKEIRSGGMPVIKKLLSARAEGDRQDSNVDVKTLIDALQKINKVFRINISGQGEPFLVPNIIEICLGLSKKHYISINTNLTPDKVKEFAEKIDPQRVRSIDASLHIKELERLDLTEKFISNFLLCKKKGFNINAAPVAYPPLCGEVSKYKKFFNQREIDFTFQKFIGKYNGRLYPEAYTEEELKTFGLEARPDVKMYNSKGKICNAGYNVFVIRANGDAFPCNGIEESMGNVSGSIVLRKSLILCPLKHCRCPLNCYDQELFERALAEQSD